MIVLDANILIRAALGVRVRGLIEAYGRQGIHFVVPEAAFPEVEKHLPSLLAKRGRSAEDLSKSLTYLHENVQIVGADVYSPYEMEARKRLRNRDENDWPILAAALALECGIWTEDTDFFGTGIATWTTSRVEILIKQQLQSLKCNED